MPAYKAAVFDLDGTLLNTLDDLADAVNRALSEFGYPPRMRKEVRAFVGNGVRLLVSRALPQGEDNPDFERVFAFFRTYYTAHAQEKTAPYPGICDTLTALRAEGVRIAVVSNKLEEAVSALCRDYFGELVEVAVGDLVGRPRKPEPDGVFAALAALGVSAEETVYIGDSDVDVLTAHRAGLPCIGVLWGFRDEDCLVAAGADHLVSDAAALRAVIENGLPRKNTAKG